MNDYLNTPDNPNKGTGGKEVITGKVLRLAPPDMETMQGGVEMRMYFPTEAPPFSPLALSKKILLSSFLANV